MQVKSVLPPTEFTPFRLEFTVEGVMDAAALFAIFNHASILMGSVGVELGRRIRDEILRATAGVELDYSAFHTALNNEFRKFNSED